MITRIFGLAAGTLVGCAVASGVRARNRAAGYSFRGKTVVITGGSRGLGLVLGRQLARAGARLAILARDPDELKRAEEEIARDGAECLTVVCDITQEAEVQSAIQRIVERFQGIDVLVNNAGTIQTGPLEQMTVADFDAAMAIHFRAPLYTILAALPHLNPNGARIVNVASIGGKIAFPHLLPYTASKFALVGLSDGFRAELRRRNIYVTTVCPGLMRTGSPRHAIFKGQHRKEYAWFSIADSAPGFSMNAETAARKIMEACRRGDARLIVGLPAKAAVWMNELMPETAANLFAWTNGVLPDARPSGAGRAHQGKESESVWTRSPLTALSQKAAAKNNQ